MVTRPLIGVMTSQQGGSRRFQLVAINLWLAGGRGVRWGAGRQGDLADVDGVLVGGGDDIGQGLDDGLDSLERALVRTAIEAGKPVLGTGRGAQTLNLALGGTLRHDAGGDGPASRRRRTTLPRQSVEIVPGSRLERIAGRADIRARTLHAHPIDLLGDGLTVAARDAGGLIQAFERAAPPFALGVRWHPERLLHARPQRALFRALVLAAGPDA